LIESTRFFQVQADGVFWIVLVEAGIDRVDVIRMAGPARIEVVLNERTSREAFADAAFVSSDEDEALGDGG
jgi:hypothetical protein